MQTLQISTFENKNEVSFQVEIIKKIFGERRVSNHRASLQQGRNTQDDGQYYALQNAACVASNYSEAEIAETDRLNKTKPIRDGDIVVIDGKNHKFELEGDYITLGNFNPV